MDDFAILVHDCVILHRLSLLPQVLVVLVSRTNPNSLYLVVSVSRFYEYFSSFPVSMFHKPSVRSKLNFLFRRF